MTLDSINKTYLSVRKEIKDLNISKKEKLVSFLISLLTSFLIVIGPILVLASLLVFKDIQAILAFIIMIFLDLFCFLTDFFTLKLITKDKVTGLYHIYIVDLLYVSITLLLIFCIILKIGVI